MGNGVLNNQIGYGGATVFNPNQAIQQFGNILAQQKADKAAKDKALVDQMANLKSDGIRAADKDDYLNKYNDWKQSLISANNMPRNSRDRLDAIATAQAKYNDLGEFIGNSKDQKAHENSLGNMMLSNGHMFSDDAHQQVTKSMASPMSSSDFINSDKYGTLERYVDPVKQDDAFDKAGKTMLKSSEWGNPIQSQGVDKQGNKTGVVVHSERQVEPADILSNAAHMYRLSPDTQHYIDKKYNTITGSTPDETMMNRLRQNAIDRGDLSVGDNGQLVSGLTEKTKPEFKADRAPDRFYQHFTFAQQNGGGIQQPAAPQTVPIMFNGQNPNKTPVTMHLRNFVPVNIPKATMIPTVGVNDDGENENLPAGEVRVIGYGEKPVVKYNNSAAKKGTIAQPDFVAQHPDLVDYEKVAHVQQDHKGHTYNYFVPQDAIGVNNSGQKSQVKAVQGAKGANSNGMVKVSLNGRIGNIPADKISQFLKENPGGIKID